MNSALKILNECRICQSSNIDVVLDLNDTPLEDQYLKTKIIQPCYPLKVLMCLDCNYVFLKHVISPKESYDTYIYESSITIGLKNHYKNYAENLLIKYKINKKSLALDIGSNDGSMLSAFKDQGLQVLGVEPATAIAKLANEKKLPTLNCFFSNEVAEKIKKKYSCADIVTANYMFANIDNIFDFLSGVKNILKENGIFVIETGYHPLQFSLNMFDYIYHEHFSYFTLKTLKILLKKFDLTIVDAEVFSQKGGSLRVTIKHKNINNKVSQNLKKLIKKEEIKDYNSTKIFKDLQNRILKEKDKLISQLELIKNKNIPIIGFGASHSTTTLMYFFKIHKYIDFIIDDNPKKTGTFSPGYHIPVFDTTEALKKNICHIVILAWQHQESIMKTHKKLILNNGLFIVPLPHFKKIEKL